MNQPNEKLLNTVLIPVTLGFSIQTLYIIFILQLVILDPSLRIFSLKLQFALKHLRPYLPLILPSKRSIFLGVGPMLNAMLGLCLTIARETLSTSINFPKSCCKKKPI